MADPLYTPKKYEEYKAADEKALLEHFIKVIGWNANLHSRASFDFMMDARAFAKDKIILDAGAGYKVCEPFFSNAKKYLSVEHPSGIAMKGMEKLHYDFVAELDGELFAPPESIDEIFSISVLEHIERPELFFRNCFSLLKPQGRVYMHCPFIYHEHETPYDFNRFTRYGLRSRLEAAGMKILRLDPSSSGFYGASAFLSLAIREESVARGRSFDTFRLQNGEETPLLPLLNYVISEIDKRFDDAVYDTTMPIGWLCVAEKIA